MGYVHDTSLCRIITPKDMFYSAGTWTDTVASNIWYAARTAADAAFTIQIPILPLQSSTALHGCYLQSLDIWWAVATAAMDSVAATLYKLTLAADTVAITTTAVVFSYDTGHDSAAERLTLAAHKMTLTITTPEWMDNDYMYYSELVCDAAATSVFRMYAARANFTLRI
mgnify:CR=1 FL=1